MKPLPRAPGTGAGLQASLCPQPSEVSLGATLLPRASPALRAPGHLAGAAALLAVSLAVRLLLVSHRWVNPDEGAHLMDGLLILDGFRPIRDFSSRQVLYSYAQAGWLALTGGGLIGARLLPILASVGTGFVLFGIGRRLFDDRAALAATALYAFFPLSVLWSLNVHLEALTLLLAGAGFYVTAGARRDEPGWARALLAGLWFGLAFYVRESVLAYLAAAAVYFAYVHRRRPGRALREVALLGAGFLAVGLAIALWYLRYLSPEQIWASQLNPLTLPIRILGAVPGPLEGANPPVGVGVVPGRFDQQPVEQGLANLRDMVALSLYLWMAVAVALGFLVRGRRGPGRPGAGDAAFYRGWDSFALPVLWLGFIAAAYAVWFAKLGFYPQYFTEFVPPLCLIAGAVAADAARRWAPGGAALAWIVALAAALGLAFLAGRYLDLNRPVYLAIACLALLLPAALARGALRGWVLLALGAALLTTAAVLGGPLLPRPLRGALNLGVGLSVFAATVVVAARALGRTDRVVGLAVAVLVGAGALLSFDAAGSLLRLSYQCVWPPGLVGPVARVIERESTPHDEVLSGAVVWALAAHRHPFLKISHPLSFLADFDPEDRAKIEAGLARRPPRIVVLDGYTEKTFGRRLPELEALIARSYREVESFDGARFPVRVYRLEAESAGSR